MIAIVAVRVDGVVSTHLPGENNYATLCGLDGNDPNVGQEPASVGRRRRVTCPDCFRLWNTCRPYALADFTAQARG